MDNSSKVYQFWQKEITRLLEVHTVNYKDSVCGRSWGEKNSTKSTEVDI